MESGKVKRERGPRRAYYMREIGKTGQFELGWIWARKRPQQTPRGWERVERIRVITQAVANKARRSHPDWGLGSALGDDYAWPLVYEKGPPCGFKKKAGARYKKTGEPILGVMGYVVLDEDEIAPFV